MPLNKPLKKSRFAMLLFLAIFVSACSEEKVNLVSPIKPTDLSEIAPKPILKNLTIRVKISDTATHTISLASSVEAQKDVTPSLVSVRSVSRNCPEPSFVNATQMTYTLSPEKSAFCVYQYTVSNKALNGTQAQSHSDNYVLIADDTNTGKEPLSLPHFSVKRKDTVPFEIDIIAELKKKNVDLTGKKISENIVIFNYQTNVIKNAAIVTPQNTILFMPDGTSTFYRLFYNMFDSKNPQYIEAGRVDVFVEQENNMLPLANNFVYPQFVKINKETSIDLAKYISDPDGDPLVIYSVSTFNASASLQKVTNSSCKTCFNFKADKRGQYKVYYVLSDKRGGYASAIATINVDNTWKDILLTSIEKNFTATPNEVQANEIKLSISSLDNYQGDPQIKVPRLAFDVAYEFCLQKGMRISHKNELVKLYQERERNLYINDGWPVTTPYWVSTNTQEALSLENLKPFNSVQEAFVTCVNTDIINITLLPLNTMLKKGETVQLTAKTENETGFPGNITKPVKWKTSNRHIATVDENGLVTGVGVGVASISATSDGVISNIYAKISIYAVKDVLITPNPIPILQLGETYQVKATPVYFNNIIPDIQGRTSWRNSSNAAYITDNGVIISQSPGTTNIYAMIDGVENKTPLVVTVFEIH